MSKKRCARCGRIYDASNGSCPYCSQRDRRTAHWLDQFGTAGAFLRRHKDRIFLVSTAVFLTIAFLGVILTRCAAEKPKPAEDGEPEKQEAETQQPEPEASPLALSHQTLSLYVGETAVLTATGGEGSAVWASSDEAVAGISEGTVTAKTAGTAAITVSCGTETVSCTVTVTEKEPEVELYLNRTDFTLRSGDPPFQMKVKVKDTRADYEGTVVWSSGDTGVVTISETGLVERVGRGSTVVTATVGGKVLECIVRVP